MSKVCFTCKGRGRWQEVHYIEGGTTLVWHECNDCHGTGVSQDPEDSDDFDVGEGVNDD